MRVTTMLTGLTAAAIAAAIALPVTASADKDQAGFTKIKPEEVVWTDKPGFTGMKFATLAGDPSKPGLYVIRAKFSPGTMTRPHWHPEARFVVVLQGTWYAGEGDVFDPAKTVPLKAGSFMSHPPKGHHFDGAKDEEVIVQIVGMGPSGTTLVDPKAGEVGPSLKK
ncbi:MAG TPA: cupin domain-containing protein [Kofleriaceae bacterium]|nr:cupin domain-containing protein [Kofleriaceae bacterium]